MPHGLADGGRGNLAAQILPWPSRMTTPPPLPRRLRTVPALLLAAALLAGCGTTVVNPVTGKAERTVMDEGAEIAEGRKAHAQVLAEYGALAQPRLQGYVSQLGQALVAQSHRAQLTWTFTVLDSPEVNAFALPGGYVYVTRGILAYLGSEAELAGVIGHEIGHVTARHGAQRATREQAAGVGVFAATLLGAVAEAAGLGGATELAARASQGVAAGVVASYSRDQELQADQLGAEYLARAHYDPHRMVDVIGVLKNQERFAADQARAAGKPPPSGANWLSSHPSNDRRLAEIREIAGRYADRATGAYGDDGRARYLAAIDGIPYGDSRAQGVTRGATFFHEELGIALPIPAGWQLENQPQALLLVNPAGDAALQWRAVPAVAAPAGATQEAVLRTLLKPTEGRSEAVSLNGLSATRFNGARRNAQGQVQALRATLVATPGGTLLLAQPLARDAAAAQRAAGALAAAEAGLRPLSAADRAAARPWVLATVPLPAGGLAELARQSPLPAAQALAQLRLINGLYGEGAAEPAAGSLVKVVR